MIPLVVEFEVAAPCAHAFDVWSGRASMWWPRSHTVTRADELEIVYEAKVGGRIFERAADGSEHEWGTITLWDPPHRISYRWHLFFDPADATDIDVTFTPSDIGTEVRIEQRGWERLGAEGPPRRTNTERAWGAVVPHYLDAVIRP